MAPQTERVFPRGWANGGESWARLSIRAFVSPHSTSNSPVDLHFTSPSYSQGGHRRYGSSLALFLAAVYAPLLAFAASPSAASGGFLSLLTRPKFRVALPLLCPSSFSS